MEQQNTQFRVCRTCLKKVSKREKMLSVFKISDLLMYTSVKIIGNDGLPSSVCNSCHKQANKAYRFIMLCEQSDQKLQSRLTSLNRTTTGITTADKNIEGNSIESEHSKHKNLLRADSPNVLLENAADNFVEQEKFPTKGEQVEPPIKKKSRIKSDHSDNESLLPEDLPDVLRENAGGSFLKLLEEQANFPTEVEQVEHPIGKNNHIIISDHSNNENLLADDSSNEIKVDSFIRILEERRKSPIKRQQGELSSEKNNHKISCDIKGEIKNIKESTNLKCQFCDLTFMQQIRLLRHEVKHENGIKCYICEKTYSTFKQLRSHINIHNRKGAHLCQTCGKQFTMPENLVRHQRIHTGVRPYKCKLCNKTFTQSNELKSHMITHSSEKTHLCNVCGNTYARQMSLQVHMRRLHSDASVIRPYSCEICNRTFKDKRDLSQHISIHKGERKHVCKICDKAFNRGSNLKVHERIHSGYRPFVCHICQRAFIQKHVLNTHLRTHPTV